MSLTTLGLFIVIIGCFFSSTKSISVKKTLSGTYELSSFDLLMRMSPISAIEMFLLSVQTKEPDRLLVSEKYQPSALKISVIFFSGFIAYFLNLTNFLATNYTSPLTVTIVGCVKQVVTIILGVLIFDKTISYLNVIGIVITILGSLWYSLLKFKKEPQKDDSKNLINDQQIPIDEVNPEFAIKDDLEDQIESFDIVK